MNVHLQLCDAPEGGSGLPGRSSTVPKTLNAIFCNAASKLSENSPTKNPSAAPDAGPANEERFKKRYYARNNHQ